MINRNLTKQEILQKKAARKRVELWSKTRSQRFVIPEAHKIIKRIYPGEKA